MKILRQYKKILGFECTFMYGRYFVHFDMSDTPFKSIMDIHIEHNRYGGDDYYHIAIDKKYLLPKVNNSFEYNEHLRGDCDLEYYEHVITEEGLVALDYLFHFFCNVIHKQFITKIRRGIMFSLMKNAINKDNKFICCFCNKNFDNLCSFCIHWKYFNGFKKIFSNNCSIEDTQHSLICESFNIFIHGYKKTYPTKKCSHMCSLEFGEKCCKCLDMRQTNNDCNIVDKIYVDGKGYIEKEIPWNKFYCNVCNDNIPYVKKLVKYNEFIQYKFYIGHIVFRDVANIITNFLFDYNKDVFVL